MRGDELIDAVQSLAIMFLVGGQIYIMTLLRNEIRTAAGAMAKVRGDYAGFNAAIAELRTQIHELKKLD